MGKRRRWFGLALLGLCIVATAQSSHSASVFFDFEGKCESQFGPGCPGFGLDDGDLVSGTISIDSALVAGGTTIDLWTGSGFLPGTDFVFSFGDVGWGLTDFDAGVNAAFQVTFDPTAETIFCLSGTTPGNTPSPDCPLSSFGGLIFTGPRIAAAFVGSNNVITDIDFAVANAPGEWRVRGPVVPEPTSGGLFLLGAAVVAARVRAITKR